MTFSFLLTLIVIYVGGNYLLDTRRSTAERLMGLVVLIVGMNLTNPDFFQQDDLLEPYVEWFLEQWQSVTGYGAAVVAILSLFIIWFFKSRR